ncbi:hypothetical protein [Pseudomonas sp. MYb185]|uniref:hypothetical protein n=1 Tax=Pseudomonas sp. MYb185 TaxID=1848729 RepID=UPI000CFA9DCB|nr:hypothetical protein [Pseudomonas sp. MYb185]PRB80515.1 hypothetical protein CQ007_12395 [Pseudomonas sp. MYb185]
MIKVIDELLREWAEWHWRELRGEAVGPMSLDCPLGRAIDSKGVMIPGTRRSGAGCDPRYPETDLVINMLRYDLERLVKMHYLTHPHQHAGNARALGYGAVKSYYRALDEAHRRIRDSLYQRLAA